MKEEQVIKADDIVSRHDVADLTLGKVVMALGIGAIFSDKLRKVAKYLVIGGALLQVPATLRVTTKAVKFAKQIKKQKAAEAEQKQAAEEAPKEDAPTEGELEPVVETVKAAAETVSDPVAEPTSDLVEKAPKLDHLNHPCEPASHPHEDPNL